MLPTPQGAHLIAQVRRLLWPERAGGEGSHGGKRGGQFIPHPHGEPLLGSVVERKTDVLDRVERKTPRELAPDLQGRGAWQEVRLPSTEAYQQHDIGTPYQETAREEYRHQP